jgi:hypothetical protein
VVDANVSEEDLGRARGVDIAMGMACCCRWKFGRWEVGKDKEGDN